MEHNCIIHTVKEFRTEALFKLTHNRVDDIIVFEQLDKESIKEIARRLLSKLSKRVGEMGIELDFDESAVEKIADEGFDPVYGARPLKRAIQSQIEDKLSEEMLEGRIKAGEKYTCRYDGENFTF